ncbi:MAG: HDOD domain-containing protein [Candidatus Nitrohelix vancouverensis]|uniref:HDOD domain-containing protein n=1 Tax=Candidatus Nitrohelix vancouverensis TaxID=2705534 RepID=A0A7T0C2I2_9BACT|nr:MAG: HDOD domain-containing protein [Candidatus Nitrohelix vancouverensis]
MDIEHLISGDNQIASLPDLFYRLKETVDEADSTFGDIGEIIAMDPGLTLRLLHLVNSAYYGFSSRVETVEHALSIIGSDQLIELVLATSVVGQFKGIPKDMIDMKGFWRHSVACGLAARTLATLSGEYKVERFFVAGLLHDVGRLVMCLKAPKEFCMAVEFARKTGDVLYRSECKIFGFDHAAVGGELLKAWRLPESLEEAVSCHHRPGAAEKYPRETAIVNIANYVAHFYAEKMDNSSGEGAYEMDPESWNVIELKKKFILPQVFAKVRDQFEEVAGIFMQSA